MNYSIQLGLRTSYFRGLSMFLDQAIQLNGLWENSSCFTTPLSCKLQIRYFQPHETFPHRSSKSVQTLQRFKQKSLQACVMIFPILTHTIPILQKRRIMLLCSNERRPCAPKLASSTCERYHRKYTTHPSSIIIPSLSSIFTLQPRPHQCPSISYKPFYAVPKTKTSQLYVAPTE